MVGALRISGVQRPFEVDGHALDRAMGKVVRRGGDHQASKRGVIGEDDAAQPLERARRVRTTRCG